jgi:hypothetical protein
MFNLEAFFNTIFQPQSGDKVVVMCDLPHAESIADNEQWKARREMAAEWVSKLSAFPSLQHIEVKPLVTYLATKGNNQDLPEMCRMGETDLSIRDLVKDNTIVIAMSENSATAPLCIYMKEFDHFRWASMPGVEKRMEETALSADYQQIHRRCLLLAPLFEKAVGVRVEFSTGHECYFDITGPAEVGLDHGLLGPEVAGTPTAGSNLPAGETYTVPNEAADSKTAGTLPVMEGGELILLDVKHNKIIGVQGSGADAEYLRGKFANDNAWANIAEVAIGVNDRAVITGNVLEDEKAGFHWAYGRSDHLEGTVGVADFKSPDDVIHQDIVYAKESPITAAKVEFVFADDTTEVVILDGELLF